jgi:hypothetical protein
MGGQAAAILAGLLWYSAFSSLPYVRRWRELREAAVNAADGERRFGMLPTSISVGVVRRVGR